MEHASPSALSKWLDKLQHDSWNLELLISGFSIFLLFGLISKLFGYFGNIWYATGQARPTLLIVNFLMMVVTLGAITLAINLVLHIVLRGFWIGAIGLRSVSKEIPTDRLAYAEPFSGLLRNTLPSLDQMIQRLDRICSGVFAFSFLIVLMFFSLFAAVLLLLGCLFVITQLTKVFPGRLNFFVGWVNAAIIFFWLIFSLVYFLDTISLGFFKRRRWMARWYFPLYRLYGRITFAYIYRSIYYHLITNYSRRKIQLALTAYLLGFAALPFVKYNQVIFFPDTHAGTELDTNFYDNLRPADAYIRSASIPDRLVRGGFLPLFIRYDVNDNPFIAAQCKDYTPSKKGGLVSGIRFRNGLKIGDPVIRETDPKALLGCLSSFYAVEIDSLGQADLPFYYFVHPQHKQIGITCMLDIRALSPGAHMLYLYKRSRRNGTFDDTPFASIPFWKNAP